MLAYADHATGKVEPGEDPVSITPAQLASDLKTCEQVKGEPAVVGMAGKVRSALTESKKQVPAGGPNEAGSASGKASVAR